MLLQKLFHPIVLYILLFNMGGYNTAIARVLPRKQAVNKRSKPWHGRQSKKAENEMDLWTA